MIRLGLADGLRGGVLNVAKYEKNWKMKSDEELKRYYDEVMGYLLIEEYGVYFAVQKIFGIEMADKVAEMGHSIRPVCS